MPRWVLFIDDGGVMSDNRLRGPQWQTLLGDFFPPRLGGTAEDWGTANRATAPQLWTDESMERLWREAGGSYSAFVNLYGLVWMKSMCEYLGRPAPPQEQCVQLAAEAAAYVRPRVRAELSGAAQAVRQLKGMGFQLFTASGEASEDLADYLGTMGVRDCFERLYGPDLIDYLKMGPEFYARIFADAGVAPEEALVVEDRPEAAGWAASLGARTVLIGAGAPGRSLPAGSVTLESLAQLPAFISG
jgi:HAD superfamily hydrolase (TIGR01509 family)